MFIDNQKQLKDLRRQLRKNMTPAERKAWGILKNRQILNLRFLRQYGVENYILDFYCPEIKLAIEVDGGQHNDEKEKLSDAARTSLMGLYGIKVIRFWNNEVMQNLDGIYQKIMEQASARKTNPS
jgi:very-short-patch-repair endonuclease